MRHIIPSLGRENICYTFRADDRNCNRSLETIGDTIFEFDTLGDGTTAHTPDRAVLTENFVDWAETVADWMQRLRNAGNTAELHDLCESLEHETRTYDMTYGNVRKALKVKHIEGKRRYYEERSFKVSSAESKQHDRRWSEINEYANGDTFENLTGLLRVFAYRRFLGGYANVEAVRGIIDDLDVNMGHSPATRVVEFLDQRLREEDHWRFRDAFTSIKAQVDAVKAEKWAARSHDCFMGNRKRRDEELEAKLQTA